MPSKLFLRVEGMIGGQGPPTHDPLISAAASGRRDAGRPPPYGPLARDPHKYVRLLLYKFQLTFISIFMSSSSELAVWMLKILSTQDIERFECLPKG